MEHTCEYCGYSDSLKSQAKKIIYTDHGNCWISSCVACDERHEGGLCEQVKGFPAYHWAQRLKNLIREIKNKDEEMILFEIGVAEEQLAGWDIDDENYN